MNNPNPLLPQGSLQGQKGKTNVRIAVFTILAIHVVLLGGLLLQGCKREDKALTQTSTLPTNSEFSAAPDPTYYSNTNLPPETVANSSSTGTPPATIVEHTAPQPAIPEPSLAPATASSGPVTEYAVVKGDSFYKISKAKNITVKALGQANPGVDSAKLKVGQKLQIPAPAVLVASNAGGTSTGSIAAGGMDAGGHLYVVKAGDTLGRIAKRTGTTIPALRTENHLQSDQIRVGQKLKLPSTQNSADKSELSPKPGREMARSSYSVLL